MLTVQTPTRGDPGRPTSQPVPVAVNTPCGVNGCGHPLACHEVTRKRTRGRCRTATAAGVCRCDRYHPLGQLPCGCREENLELFGHADACAQTLDEGRDVRWNPS